MGSVVSVWISGTDERGDGGHSAHLMNILPFCSIGVAVAALATVLHAASAADDASVLTAVTEVVNLPSESKVEVELRKNIVDVK